MRLTRLSIRSAAVTAAALGLVAGMSAAPPFAQAAPPTLGLAAANQAAALATALDSAGSYLDPQGRMVVTVTSETAAGTVEAAGFVARVVTYSATDLARVTSALSAAPTITGTTWSVDPVSNQVLVTYDDTVSAGDLASIEGVTARFGTAARVEHSPGVLRPFVAGGDAIFGGGSRCSLGFNAESTSSGTDYFITAGHCTNISASWTFSGGSGTRVVTSFPSNDYGVVQFNSGTRPGVVNLYNGSTRDITGAANAVVGQSGQRSGSTTQVRSGTVTGLNATVNYPQGTVFQMIRTSICAQPGDSGGSMFSGNTALGITSGGSGNCSSGGTTFFQPVTEVLNLGLRVL